MLLLSGWLTAWTPAAPSIEPWHLAGWQFRAVVAIPQPVGDPVDTAAVKVLSCGRAKPDGSDFRVLDADGKPVPFQIVFHDAARYSLIAFRAPDPRKTHFVYFGNESATRAAEQLTDIPALGTGPLQPSAGSGGWIPRHGLVLTTIERPDGPNPEKFEEMTKLIAASKRPLGARFQRRISDGYNSFGPSDNFISIYHGWINIPAAGRYEFCTASNEASFSFLDGKELVHWPGRHTEERGAHGEKNAAVELTAGPHFVEYYHEEVTLTQMAFLGWRPPGAVAFGAIPESVFTAPHPAVVTRYENPNGPIAAFEPTIVSSVWPAPTVRSEGQYTLARFAVQPAGSNAAGANFRWDFGDGQTATGPQVEHVYLSLGTYKVSLTSEGPAGRSSATWPLEAFEIEHVTPEFPEGKLTDYLASAKSFDRSKLDAASLRELAYLISEAGDANEAIAVGKQFVDRFPQTPRLESARVRRLMAENAIRLGSGGLDEAIANFQASITDETPAVEKLDVLGRLIRLVGIERNLPDKAGEFLVQVEDTFKNNRRTAEVLAAYRRAIIAGGDVLLWNAKRNGARDLYRRAEALSQPIIPPQVRAARVGAYPNSLRELIASGNLSAALNIVQRWEEDFPTDKLTGETFFWRGKLMHLRDSQRDAAQFLARAVSLAPGASFESEARWLLALSLEKLGKTDDARRELAKLVATGIQDEYTALAKKRLANQPANK
jgi:tetratricopeptide (TPR) repeat protein